MESIEISKNHHLRFCEICKNREWNTHSGVICGLTKQVPTFEFDCTSFSLNQFKLERIAAKKINSYGLFKKEKGFVQEMFSNDSIRTRLTQFVPIIKPKTTQDLPDHFKVSKSKIKYILISLIPTLFILAATREILLKGTDSLLIGFIGICFASLAWILFDYIRNNNSFSINRNGIKYQGDMISWQVIMATLIRETAYQGHNDKHLILVVPTKKDIEIKLNGLIGPSLKIENYIELYKKEFKEKRIST